MLRGEFVNFWELKGLMGRMLSRDLNIGFARRVKTNAYIESESRGIQL